ncbi:hypothetical protein H0H81_006798, partial [Sphagnurus paluster]
MEALRNALAVNIDPDDPGTPLEDKHYPQHWWCHLKSTGSNAKTVNVKYLEEYTESYNRRLNMLLPPRLSSHSYDISKLAKDVGEVFAQASNYSVIFEHRERFSARRASGLMALYELGAQRTVPDDVPTVEDVRRLFEMKKKGREYTGYLGIYKSLPGALPDGGWSPDPSLSLPKEEIYDHFKTTAPPSIPSSPAPQ